MALAPTGPTLRQVNLCGRAGELAVIDAAAALPATRAVVVTGEPGSGKSALLATSVAALAGRRVLSLRGYQPE